MKKRIVSLLMAVLMLVTMLPVAAMAEELTMTDPTEEQVVSGETTPDPSEEPETPEEPNQPEEPDQPGKPSEPEEPEQPETPQEPEQPVENDPEEAAPDNENDIALFAGEGGSVTRIAWVQMLVSAFDMTVEEDNYPDNYYTDIDSTAAYYRDLMVAVEFGVIDLEAGLPFEPDEPATREFAAHTLNYCLGFQLDSSTYTYTDTADVTYKDDVQVAVNRGWFALVNGKFLPQQAMTSAEAAAMVADAKQVLEGTVVSETYNSTYIFKANVIEIPDGTEVQVEDGVVRITDCPKPLTNGCIFVVYVNEIPVPYIATAVAVDGNVTVVTATRAEDSDVFESVDAQGVFEADLSQTEALDGGEMTYYVEELDQEFQTYAMAQAAASRLGAAKVQPVYNHDLDLGNGVTLKLDARTENVKTSFRIDSRRDSVYVNVSGDLTLDYQLKGDIGSALKMSDIHMIYVPVSIGSFTVSLDAEFSGQVSGIQTWHIEAGIQASVNDGVNLIRSIETRSSTLDTAATAKFGVQARLGITDLPGVSAYLYAKAGCLAKLKGNTYNDGAAPQKCVHFLMYAYAECGAAGSLTMPLSGTKHKISKKYEIYNQNNSPVRVVHHYEDNALVPSCTRGKVSSWFDGNYGYWRTPASSRYMSSGWSSGFGGNGYDKDGNPVTLYTYTLDDEDNATITAYKGNATAVVIPSKLDGYTVVAIGYGAFRGNNNLRAVTIPDTVTSIGDYAFYVCKKLSDVALSSTLTSLGSNAFGDCTSLTSIVIPKAVQSAGAYGPFNGCSALTNVTLEQGMAVVPANLFRKCSGLVSIKIPNSVTSIGVEAFGYCDSLKNVEIPDSVTEIKYGAFRSCTSLEKIVIPDTVTSIGDYAFDNCKKLSEVTLSSTLTSLGSNAFGDCTSLTSIVIPKTVQSAGAYGPFNGCSALTNVTLEQGMAVVPANLFRKCSGLVSIKIPNSVTSIGVEAFGYCDSLKNVEIPDSVTEIKYGAFRSCTSLEKIVIPDTVTSLGAFIFDGCKKLSEVKLPNTRQNIVQSMFQDCTSLKTIILPDTVTTIQSSAFSGCTALETIVFPDSLTSIQGSAFLNCSSLKNVTWSKNLTSIDSSAFSNCSALETLELPISVTNLGYGAFSNCDGLTTIIVPDSVTELGTNVFYDCDALTSVKLGSGITTIPESTFEHCDVLESIVIPRRVTTIGNNAFKNCVKFTSITIPRSVTSISSNVFSYPAKMTIYGVAGTYAETFANANNIRFVDKQVNATAVTLSSKELTLSKGASATLFLTVTPEDFTDEVSWKSGNTSVVTVNDAGVIKAVGLGTATIKVVVGSKSASCKVTVQQPVTSISLNKTSLTLEALATYQLTATAYPNNAVDRRVSWSSSAPDIASVDDNGLITARKKGSAIVTATAMDGSDVTKKCTVTVSNTAYICATVEAMESPHNYPNSCSDFWVYTIPGAEKLRVTFDARTDIEDGFDYLYVFDGTGKQVGKYTGTELAGQTITIPGDTVKLKLVSDGSGNEWGFKVSRISSGTASGTVAGNVTTGGNAADPVTIVFKQNGNTVKTATVSGGSYRVSGLTDGSYTLEASKPGCVPRSYTVTVKDGEVVNSPNVVLVATGNVNGVSVSGEDVEITDVACLYRYLTANDRSQSSIPDEAYFLAVADVNSDGAVDVYDLQLLYETVSGIAKT